MITDLHVAHVANQGYMPYDTGHAGDHFVKKADGTEFVGIVWPGPAVFPDFTRAQTREWWGNLYKQFVDDGVAGFWNDMNEPAVFNGPAFTMPLDNIHRIDEPGFATRTATHAEIHNVLGMENERATYEGLLKLRPNERPFVVTRATYAGGQRYSFTWTGDNSSTWNQLRLGTQQTLNLGLSGISFVGDDVGGFGGSPPPDLLTRWIEIGAFKPLYRDHSTKGSLQQEVWVHGPEHEAIRRRYIETRYRLLPYIYTLADEASRTGVPLVRPLFLEFPDYFSAIDTEFLLGPALLVAPAAQRRNARGLHRLVILRAIGSTSGRARKCRTPPLAPTSFRSATPSPRARRCLRASPPRFTPRLRPCPCTLAAAALFPCSP